jgi:hypothetical protein
MIPIVCYSHSEYEDVIRVQNVFIERYPGPKWLCIDKPPSFSHSFDRILLYSDSDPYSERVRTCMMKIDASHVLFLHDIDLLVHFDSVFLQNVYWCMVSNSIDRVDLKWIRDCCSPVQYRVGDVVLCEPLHDSYRYNVNPSIWNVNSFSQFLDCQPKSYRHVEDATMQERALSYKMYKLHSPTMVRSGYFHLTPLFVYLHITHLGGLLPPTENNLEPWLEIIYMGIRNLYTFRRPVRNTKLQVYIEYGKDDHIYEVSL